MSNSESKIEVVPGIYLTKLKVDLKETSVMITGKTDNLRLYVANEAQAQLLEKYKEQRDIEDTWGILRSVILDLTKRDSAAMDAVIYYTRGEILEDFSACNVCAKDTPYSPVFEDCVILP